MVAGKLRARISGIDNQLFGSSFLDFMTEIFSMWLLTSDIELKC